MKHDFVLIGLICVLVAMLSSWITLAFIPVSVDSSKENQPINIVIKETVYVIQQRK